MPECIHGLEFALCDACSPKPKPVVEPVVARQRVAKAPAARSLKVKAPTRLHVVLYLEELADALADGELIDPIYYVGPEEVAWGERRRSKRALEQVVLVVPADKVAGLDVLPLGAVQLVAVANTVAQEKVRDLLAMTQVSAKVAVHPPWFVAPED
jgi:hypothetical protein